ncbi:hypothetical protein, conserved [Leishmania tarentolae]|uniref:CULT domain-containing protein n=1 Tax=Leishmania tarentolae TaxID=5689 RepID=A0A640KXE5_LEITA|nr:hypothetical protein, conserved [Leishmania tarentolae]GET94028.1 hypothetical protein, conserved [Leishmania tarentolae]
MTASPSSPSTTASSASTGPQDTVEVLLCDNCRCPIGSLWDVLPAEDAAPVWRAQVYSYELDLFANGSPPIQAYSATNPSSHRFDLLRLAPYVTVHRVPTTSGAAPPPGVDAARSCDAGTSTTVASAPNVQEFERVEQVEQLSTAHAQPMDATKTRGAACTTLHAPSLVECSTAIYSTEHSFFTGYAWCFCHCSNCNAFLGWGFAAADRLRAAQPLLRGSTSGGISQTGEMGRARQTESARRAETETAPVAVVGDSQPAEARSTPAALGASMDPHQKRLFEDDERCGNSAAASHLSSPDDSHNDGTHDDASTTTTCNSSAICDSGSGSNGEQHTNTGVEPDFMGIIITRCTGDPHYPIASLLSHLESHAARQRRRQRLDGLTHRLSLLLPQIRDPFRAHELYYSYHAMEELLYSAPFPPPQDAFRGVTAAVPPYPFYADEDGVPICMLATVEAARIAVATQLDRGHDTSGSGSSTNSSSLETDHSS